MKKNILLFFVIIFLLQNDFLHSQNIDETDSLTTVSFSVVGDLIVHGGQLKYARVDSNTYNFKPVFREVKPFLESRDFAMANLEVVFRGSEKKYSGYPIFNTPDSFLEAIKCAGIDLLFTANNHALDFGKEGVERTIDLLDSNGIQHSGTFKFEEEKDSIFVNNINGISFAVLSYSYLTNRNIKKGYEYMLNIIKLRQIRKDVLKAKAMNLDLVIVYLHFGDEYEREPSEYQIETVKSVKSYGADLILASHTHAIQPVEMFKPRNSKLDSGFVTYSLGNFISNQRWRYSDAGVILNFSITKNLKTNRLTVSEFDFIPTWVFRGITDKGKEFVILPAEYSESDLLPAYVTKKDKELMMQSFEDTKEIITKSTSRLKLKSVLKK